MIRARLIGVAALTITITIVAQPSAQFSIQDLQTEQNRLLLTYSDYKRYGLKTAADVYAHIKEEDRRAVFQSVTRALFVQPQTARGVITGPPLIRHVEQLQGIWGVRRNERNGRRVFRVSLRWTPGIHEALQTAENLPRKRLGHVLLGVPQSGRGDDNPNAQASEFVIRDWWDSFTHRQDRPGLQLSFLNNDRLTGEVDIDFDDDGCHNNPANSDAGSGSTSQHEHVGLLNAAFGFFPTPLSLPNWVSSQFHCQPYYK